MTWRITREVKARLISAQVTEDIGTEAYRHFSRERRFAFPTNPLWCLVELKAISSGFGTGVQRRQIAELLTSYPPLERELSGVGT